MRARLEYDDKAAFLERVAAWLWTRTAVIVGAVALLTAVSGSASAQTGAVSGIAGLVRDTSGAVLPGVNVEASSPALIEQVVSVVTDSQGQYKLVNLRPGNYTVVFSLAGFGSVKRAGIELTVGFTAPLNVEMAKTLRNLEKRLSKAENK